MLKKLIGKRVSVTFVKSVGAGFSEAVSGEVIDAEGSLIHLKVDSHNIEVKELDKIINCSSSEFRDLEIWK